jgi:hypothetical protein
LTSRERFEQLSSEGGAIDDIDRLRRNYNPSEEVERYLEAITGKGGKRIQLLSLIAENNNPGVGEISNELGTDVDHTYELIDDLGDSEGMLAKLVEERDGECELTYEGAALYDISTNIFKRRVEEI